MCLEIEELKMMRVYKSHHIVQDRHENCFNNPFTTKHEKHAFVSVAIANFFLPESAHKIINVKSEKELFVSPDAKIFYIL